MKKIIWLFLTGFFLACGTTHAQTALYPTIPGTQVRDYTRPGWVIEGPSAYPTLPGTSIRDYSRRGYIKDRDVLYPTLPGTDIRDYTQPGFILEDE